ncbi:MAG: aminotransferase class V-fold PLP-dependent enzyme [Pirellulales bacterium]
MTDVTPPGPPPSNPGPASLPPTHPLQVFRERMPVVQSWAYLDHAAVAPLPSPAVAALAQWAQQASSDGDVHWPQWAGRVEQVRRRAASLINANPEEIAFVPNTTVGLSFIAEGYPWSTGDNVVSLAHEFPSNRHPWLHLASRGVTTRLVETPAGRVDPQRIAEACDSRTRILAVSWVDYLTGWRLDLDEIVELAHRRGILVALDAIQGLGVFPLDVRRTAIDFLAADGHKWQLGPEGAGLMFVQARHLELLRPIGVGWHSVQKPYEFHQPVFDLRPDAARWEGGSANMPGLHAYGASLDLLAEAGLSPHDSSFANHVSELANEVADWVVAHGAQLAAPRDPGHVSGIVSFRWDDRDSKMLRTRCLAAGVVLSVRGDWLRVSPHAYNTRADLERLFAVLGE